MIEFILNLTYRVRIYAFHTNIPGTSYGRPENIPLVPRTFLLDKMYAGTMKVILGTGVNINKLIFEIILVINKIKKLGIEIKRNIYVCVVCISYLYPL